MSIDLLIKHQHPIFYFFIGGNAAKLFSYLSSGIGSFVIEMSFNSLSSFNFFLKIIFK